MQRKNQGTPGLSQLKSVPALLVSLLLIILAGIAYIIIKNNTTSYDEHAKYSFDLDPSIGIETLTDDDNLDETAFSRAFEAYEERKAELSGSGQTSPVTDPTWWTYPNDIQTATRDGDDLLLLVNKQYKLPSDYEPSDLVSISNSGIRVTKSGMLVRNTIVSDLTSLANAAAAENIDLAVLSAYRSYATQQSTYNYWVSYNGGNTDAADMVSARPGHSQHQLGTTVDFTTNEISDQLGQHFGNTKAGEWLAQHSWEYGFALAYPSGYESTTGYSYEPWHFRYIGKTNAAEWHGSGEILEVWLRGKN